MAYDRLKIWADKKNVLPTKIECLTEANMLIKTLYFKDVKDFGGGIKRPAVTETDSPLFKGYKSIIIFAGVKKRDFKDEVFTLTFMPNLESLRDRDNAFETRPSGRLFALAWPGGSRWMITVAGTIDAALSAELAGRWAHCSCLLILCRLRCAPRRPTPSTSRRLRKSLTTSAAMWR